MAPSSLALSQTAVEVTIWEEYLLRNKTNIARTLCAYSLDNGPSHETDDARFIFRFTAYDWLNNIEEVLRRENIHCDVVHHREMKPAAAPKRIVIANMDAQSACEITSGLRAAGYVVDYYASAPGARSSLASVGMFIVDRQSSAVDGLQICRQLRAHPVTKDVPILLLSAEAKKNHEALLAGATDCIETPVHVHHLLNVIARHLKS